MARLRLFYNWFQMVIGCFTLVLMVWLLFSFVHSFPFAWFFCCCYTLVRNFHFVSRDVAFHMANQSLHSITILAGIISALGREIYFFITHLWPRIQGRIGIYIYTSNYILTVVSLYEDHCLAIASNHIILNGTEATDKFVCAWSVIVMESSVSSK